MSPEKVGLLDDPVQLAEADPPEYGAQLPARRTTRVAP